MRLAALEPSRVSALVPTSASVYENSMDELECWDEYFGYFAEDVKRNAMMYLEANILSNMRTDFRLT
jgi:hypothetical protein